MRRIIAGIFICCFVLGTLFYVYYREKNSWSNFASNSPTEDSMLHNIDSENIQIQEFEKTGFTWRDSKGNEYPVYMARTGSCFVIRTSKSGENYKSYLGKDVSEQIRKVLSTRKKTL